MIGRDLLRLPTHRHWPLRCTGTALPVPLLVAVKLLLLHLFAHNEPGNYDRVFLPLWSLFHPLEGSLVFGWLLRVAFWVGGLAVLFNYRVRAGCLLAGGAVLLSLLAYRLGYSNNRVLCAVFLLLAGLYDPRVGLWPLRIQISIVYGGAALNKLLHPDWPDGRFFEYWTTTIFPNPTYRELAALFPEGTLSAGMAWLVIGIEFALCMGFLVPRLFGWAVALGVAFHSGMLVFTAGVFSRIFFYKMVACYFVFLRHPRPLAAFTPADTSRASCLASPWLGWLAPDALVLRNSPGIASKGGAVERESPSALRLLVIDNPAFYLATAFALLALRIF